MSHHNVKKRIEAAKKLKLLIKSDKSYMAMHKETIKEIMKNYCGIDNELNKVMMELAIYLFSNMSAGDLKDEAKRIWLSIGIGLTEMLIIKQRCSMKLLWSVIDRFPLLIFEEIKSIKFMLDIVVHVGSITNKKVEILSRINLIFLSYNKKVEQDSNTSVYYLEIIDNEYENYKEFVEKIFEIIKDIVCDFDYLNNINMNYEMICSENQEKTLVKINNILLCFQTCKNMFDFVNNFYIYNKEIKKNIIEYTSQQFDKYILKKVKNIYPLLQSCKKLSKLVDMINLNYCEIVCMSMKYLSGMTNSIINYQMINYFNQMINISKYQNIKIIKKYSNVLYSIFNEFISKQKIYTEQIFDLILIFFNQDLYIDINESDLDFLTQTLIVIIQNADFFKFKNDL